jgi:hypothetical protein
MAGLRAGTWGGWTYYDSDEEGQRVHLRFSEDERGRLRVTELHISRAAGISTSTMRTLPLGQIEAAANNEALAEKIKNSLRSPRPEQVELDEKFWAERAAIGPISLEPPPKVPALLRPPKMLRGQRYPDEFYEELSALYGRVAGRRSDPVKWIADQNGLPVRIVHRWLTEARRRALLTPGRLRARKVSST